MNDSTRTDAGIGLEALGDVEVGVSVQLGRARLPLSSIVGFSPGDVISLDTKADEPATLLINGVPVASGEIVIDEDGVLSVEIGRMLR
jgi:flagellar motor switch protein FliN